MIYFQLLAYNDEAERITSDSQNQSFRVFSPRGKPCLQVGDFYKTKNSSNLITFGKDLNACDVFLGNSKYFSKTHCYIYIHPLSGEFVLRDVSASQGTILDMDGDKRYRLQGNPRRRVLPRGRVSRIAFNEVIFELD